MHPVSLWLPFFKTERLWQASDHKNAKPSIRVTTQGKRISVSAVNQPAWTMGMRTGMSFSDARALSPDLLWEKETAYMRHQDEDCAHRLVSYLYRFSPRVALDSSNPDEHFIDSHGGCHFWLDSKGCSHLFGGDQIYLQTIEKMLRHFGFTSHIAMAETFGTAWALARYCTQRPFIACSSQGKEPLLPLPNQALRLPESLARELNQVGLRTIADLCQIPISSLNSRYGPLLSKRLLQAIGTIPEAITFPIPISPYHYAQRFDPPLGEKASLAIASAAGAKQLCERLAADGKGALTLILQCDFHQQISKPYKIDFSIASADPTHWHYFLEKKIEGLDLSASVDGIRLIVSATLPLNYQTHNLFRSTSSHSSMGQLLDTLRHRIGQKAVFWPALNDSHLPETMPQRTLWASKTTQAMEVNLLPYQSPLHLLRKPQALFIESTCSSLKKFAWRRRLFHVKSMKGPRRISPCWWQGQQGDYRDYYTVQTLEGFRFWLFHAQRKAQWYVHGIFP